MAIQDLILLKIGVDPMKHTRMMREGAEACNKAIGLGSNETICCLLL